MNNRTSQLLCAWSGIITMVWMFIGLWLAKWLPVPSPNMSANEVVAMYQNNLDGIRACAVFVLISAGFSLMWTCEMSAQLRRIESGRTPIWTYVNLAGGCGGAFFFLIPALMWTMAAFRPERAPEITQALNDIGFLFFLMPFIFATTECLALGCAILSDKKKNPVFPRWVGFANLWFALLFVPACITGFFKTGVFAWDGLFTWWVPVVDYTVWSIVMSVCCASAVKRQYAEEGKGMGVDAT